MAFGIKPGAPTRINPRSVSSKPHFPVGARPMNVYGPRINEHAPTVPAMGGMTEPSPAPPTVPTTQRNYGKTGGGFKPFGGM